MKMDLQKKEKRFSLYILIIVLSSAVVKLFYVFKFTEYKTFLFSDCLGYWLRAEQRFNGNIFDNNQWDLMPPGYHIVLAEIFKILHFFNADQYRLEIILILQILLCTVSVYALYQIALKTIRNHTVALLAAGTYAFSYVMIFFKAFILSENIAIPLIIISLFFLFEESSLSLILSGFLLACGAWVRPWYSILFLSFVCYLFLKDRPLRMRNLTSFCLPFIIVMSLIVLENSYISRGRVIGLGTNGGIAFYLSLAKPYKITVHYPNGGYTFFSPPNTLGHPEYGEIHTTVPFNDNKYYYNLSKEYIKGHPTVFFRKIIDLREMIFSPLFPNTSKALWFEKLVEPSRWIALIMCIFSSMIWLVFKSGNRDRLKLWLLVSIPLTLLSLNYFFNTEYRYFYAFAFVLHILCFASIFEIINRWKNGFQNLFSKNNIKNTLINILLILGSSLLGLILVELFFRPPHTKFENFILKNGEGDLVHKFYNKLFKYDPDLGWIPIPNTSVIKWGGKVSTLDGGIRSNGSHHKLINNFSILAIGDSFTFCDLVPDDQTWPSFLEELTHTKVYNAGVSSYGLDQTILRLEKEKLIEKYDPKVIILNIIYDDTERCLQTIRHGNPKPYFILKNNELIPQKPVPFYGLRFDWFRQIFGYSYICHKIMSSKFPQYWRSGTSEDFRSINGDALKISELLFDRFMKSAQSRDVIFLVQEWTHKDLLDSLINYIKTNYPNVRIINMTPLLLEMNQKNPQELHTILSGHMTPKGNKFIAELIASELSKFPDFKTK